MNGGNYYQNLIPSICSICEGVSFKITEMLSTLEAVFLYQVN